MVYIFPRTVAITIISTFSTTATVACELFLFGGCAQGSKSASNDLYTFSTRDFLITLEKTSGQGPDHVARIVPRSQALPF